ncbi:conserved hypothetical protein [Trichinella spiralis]|uniref:hypothetical protein n=1 Tax=Trichinella spiralis TaxID=6334 RepID=UPI0001EFE9AA|nr:conserved hypothetical protein [Trichinella spiralis]
MGLLISCSTMNNRDAVIEDVLAAHKLQDVSAGRSGNTYLDSNDIWPVWTWYAGRLQNPDRSGFVVWAQYGAFCAICPLLRGNSWSINGDNSRVVSVDQLKSGRRRVTLGAGRQWS